MQRIFLIFTLAAIGQCTPIVSVWMSVCVCVYMCLPPLWLLKISGVMWTLYDRLNKFSSFYMAAIVGTVSRCGLNLSVS